MKNKEKDWNIEWTHILLGFVSIPLSLAIISLQNDVTYLNKRIIELENKNKQVEEKENK